MSFNTARYRFSAFPLVLWGILAVWFFNAFGIFTPSMPIYGLDPSWHYGLNQAVAQGLTFGKDIIFTLGPYASVFTHEYHPATVHLMVFGTVLVDALFVACFVWMVKDARWRWPLILIAILTVPLTTEDAFLLSVPLLLGLVIFKLLYCCQRELLSKVSTQILLILAFGAIGILPLIKGTLILAAAGNCALFSMLLAINKRRLLAGVCLIAPLLSMAILWCASGQRLGVLPAFFATMRMLISGYSEAMGTFGAFPALVFYLAGAVLVLLTIALKKEVSAVPKAFLLLLYAAYLGLALKMGFVRHTHSIEAINSLLIGVLFLFLLKNTKLSFASPTLRMLLVLTALVGSLSVWSENFVNEIRALEPPAKRHKDYPVLKLLAYLKSDLGTKKLLSTAVMGQPYQMRPWNFAMDSWHTQFEAARLVLRKESNLNFALSGTADIYSAELSSFLANDYQWDPRPVFQSYSAYTPLLARLNEQHLRSTEAPNDLIVQLETVDGRLPSLDDGLSWPAMLDNYQVAEGTPDWIHLTRRAATIKNVSRFTSTQSVDAKLGEEITVPPLSGPIFATVNGGPTSFGKLVILAFKVPPLIMRVTKANGEKADFRVNASMMKTGFFLSPLVTNNQDFRNLFDPNNPSLQSDRVASFMIYAVKDGKLYWKDDITVTFEQYQFE